MKLIKETFAVVANIIDWRKVFPRQCPKLVVQSFLKNGVCPSLIPVIKRFFRTEKYSKMAWLPINKKIP